MIGDRLSCGERMEKTLDIASATGVDLQLNIAGPGARSYAFVIDWHIRVLLALAWFLVLHLILVGTAPVDSGSPGLGLYTWLVIVPAACIYFLYHPVLEISMRGRTPGKRMAGVRVVTHQAQEPGVLANLIRNLLRLLDSLPAFYVIGLVATVVTRNAVRIGDMAAGTVLIYESDARAEKLDTVPVSPDAIDRHGLELAELTQDLLNRWNELETDRRRQLALKLLARLDPQFSPDEAPADLRDRLERALSGERAF
jgi:uncharacterized RDD family membrane protein YckC